MVIYEPDGTKRYVVLTKEAEHEEELMRGDFVRLSWVDADYYVLPVGSYIIPFEDVKDVDGNAARFTLYKEYAPNDTNQGFRYEPEFQHPKMWLQYVPFLFETQDATGATVKKTEHNEVGRLSDIMGYICNFMNEALGLTAVHSDSPGYDTEFIVLYSKVDSNQTVSVMFSEDNVLSAIGKVTDVVGCEWHIDWQLKVLYIGRVETSSTPFDLVVDGNVGTPSVTRSKEYVYNRYLVQGSTRNNVRRTEHGWQATGTRLTLDETQYPNSIIVLDGHDGEPPMTGILTLDDVYPHLDLYLYDLVERRKWKKNDKGEVIGERWSVWYTRLAYYDTNQSSSPAFIKDGVQYYWHDYKPIGDIVKAKVVDKSFYEEEVGGLLQDVYELVISIPYNEAFFTNKENGVKLLWNGTEYTCRLRYGNGGNTAILLSDTQESQTIYNTVSEGTELTFSSGFNTYYLPSENVADSWMVDGLAPSIAFRVNDDSNAKVSPLGTREFEVNYISKAVTFNLADDVEPPSVAADRGYKGYTLPAGYFEIIHTEEGSDKLIIPTTSEIGICPLAEATPSRVNNLGFLFNVAPDSAMLGKGKEELLKAAQREIANIIADTNNYTFQSNPVAFAENDPNLIIGKKVRYNAYGYQLETRILKLVTKVDYPFEQSITIGEKILKGVNARLRDEIDALKNDFEGWATGYGIVDTSPKNVVDVNYDTWSQSGLYYHESLNRFHTNSNGEIEPIIEQSYVMYLGCKWKCMRTLTTEEPFIGCTDWKVVEGDSKVTLRFFDKNGVPYGETLNVNPSSMNAVLIPRLYFGSVDISSRVGAMAWVWRRSVQPSTWTPYYVDEMGFETVTSTRCILVDSTDIPLDYRDGGVGFSCAVTISGLIVENTIRIEDDTYHYLVDLSDYVDTITIDDVGNVIGGLYKLDEDDVPYDYRIHSAINVRRNTDLLILAESSENASIGTYKIYTEAVGCSCVLENSTIYITGIDNVKDGVAGSDDDTEFDYDAMRAMDSCYVNLVIDCEGVTSIIKKFPITIKHDSQPFVGADMENEHSGVSWNEKTGTFAVGLPIEIPLRMWHNDTDLEITGLSIKVGSTTLEYGRMTYASIDPITGEDVLLKTPFGLLSNSTFPYGIVITTRDETIHGVVRPVLRVTEANATLPNQTDIIVTITAVYAGISYERTLVHTITRTNDLAVYGLDIIPAIIHRRKSETGTQAVTATIYGESSDDGRYAVAATQATGKGLCIMGRLLTTETEAQRQAIITAAQGFAALSQWTSNGWTQSASATLNTLTMTAAGTTSGVLFALVQGGKLYLGEIEYVPVTVDGEDGTDVEFVFYAPAATGKAPNIPTLCYTTDRNSTDVSSAPATYQNAGFLPYVQSASGQNTVQWTDDPTGVAANRTFEYYARRERINGVWGAFSVAHVWSHYAEDGLPGESSIVLDFDNENSFVQALADGTVVGTPETSTARVMVGGVDKSAHFSFSIDSQATQGCSATINAGGVVTPYNLDDNAETEVMVVVVVATPNTTGSYTDYADTNLTLRGNYYIRKKYSTCIYSLQVSQHAVYLDTQGNIKNQTVAISVVKSEMGNRTVLTTAAQLSLLGLYVQVSGYNEPLGTLELTKSSDPNLTNLLSGTDHFTISLFDQHTESASDDELWDSETLYTVADGADGTITIQDGQNTIRSIIFCRTDYTPDTPTYGSYEQPSPNESSNTWQVKRNGTAISGVYWHDGIPAGSGILWSSSRIFTSDGESPQQAAWSQPGRVGDTELYDVEFSPAPLTSMPADPSTDSSIWYDPSETLEEDGLEWTDMNWRAERVKVNGTWGAWVVTQIQGEDGEDGEDGITYEIVTDASTIVTDASGTVRTGNISVRAYMTQGDTRSQIELPSGRVPETTDYKVQYSVDGGTWNDCTLYNVIEDEVITRVYGVPSASVRTVATSLGLRLLEGSTVLYEAAPLMVVSDGEQGDDAAVYYLATNTKSVSANNDGYPLNTTQVSVSIMKRVGDGDAALAEAGTVYYRWCYVRGSTKTIISNNWNTNAAFTDNIPTNISCESYEFAVFSDNTYATMLCEPLSIPLVREGAPGPRGYEGLIIRTTEWEAGKNYRNDSEVYNTADGRRYLDIVTVTDASTGNNGLFGGSSYVATEEHNGVTSSSSNKPVAGGNTWWDEMTSTGPVKTPLLWALNALIQYLQVNQITVVDEDGNLIGRIGSVDDNDNYPIVFGTDITQASGINFYVDVNGHMYCVGADIHGNVTIKGDDGLVVLDSNGNERVRISPTDFGTPPSDTMMILQATPSVSIGDSPNINIAETSLTNAQRDLVIAEAQMLHGDLELTLHRDTTYATATGTGITVTANIKLFKNSDLTTPVATDTITKQVAQGDVFQAYVLGSVDSTAIGRYLSAESGIYVVKASVSIMGVTSSNFSFYNSGSCDGVVRLNANIVLGEKTIIAPNGLLVNAGTKRHLMVTKNSIEMMWNGAGFKLDDSGLQRLVGNGLWVDAFGKSRSVREDTVLGEDDRNVFVYTTSGGVEITLPTSYDGHEIYIRRITSNNTVTVKAPSIVAREGTIDGSIASSVTINNQKMHRYVRFNAIWYEDEFN